MKRTIFRIFVMVAGLCFALTAFDAHANIVIKVRALNPLESEETASIYYPLPKEVTPGDIIEKKITFSLPKEEGEEVQSTFNVEYVKEQGNYYIIDSVLLGPREVVTLEVHVRDIWSIPPERLSSLRRDVEEMIVQAEQAVQSPDGETVEASLDETAVALKEEIFLQLDGILTRQAGSTVMRVGVEKHMEAYSENVDALGQLQADISMLRFLLKPPEEEGEDGEEGDADSLENEASAPVSGEAAPGGEEEPEPGE